MLSHVIGTRGSKASADDGELVIEHREALIFMICEAAEMEHALMCEYLFAAFSLKERQDEGLTAEQIETAILADVAVGLMYDAVEPLGRMLGTMPVGPGHPGATAGAPFELFYQPDYLLPHHRAAWLLFAERLEEAASFATRLSATAEPLPTVAAALTRHARRLTSATSPGG